MAYDFNEYPIFRGLNSTQVHNFVAACKDELHPTDTALIEQGKCGDRVYFIYEGQVRIQIGAPHDGLRELASLSAPAVLGEMEFLTGKPRSASALTITEVRTLSIPFEALQARVDDGDPATLKIFYNVATVVAHRLAEMDKKLSEIELEQPERTADLESFHRKIFEDWNV